MARRRRAAAEEALCVCGIVRDATRRPTITTIASPIERAPICHERGGDGGRGGGGYGVGHYVTIFMLAEAPEDAEPQNLEPHKCLGWRWFTWSEMSALPKARLFVPLQNLLRAEGSEVPRWL